MSMPEYIWRLINKQPLGPVWRWIDHYLDAFPHQNIKRHNLHYYLDKNGKIVDLQPPLYTMADFRDFFQEDLEWNFNQDETQNLFGERSRKGKGKGTERSTVRQPSNPPNRTSASSTSSRPPSTPTDSTPIGAPPQRHHSQRASSQHGNSYGRWRNESRHRDRQDYWNKKW